MSRSGTLRIKYIYGVSNLFLGKLEVIKIRITSVRREQQNKQQKGFTVISGIEGSNPTRRESILGSPSSNILVSTLRNWYPLNGDPTTKYFNLKF